MTYPMRIYITIVWWHYCAHGK